MRDRSRTEAEVRANGAGPAAESRGRAARLAAVLQASHLPVARWVGAVVMVLAVATAASMSVSTSVALFLCGLAVVLGFAGRPMAEVTSAFIALAASAIAAYQLLTHEFGLAVGLPLPTGPMAPNTAAAILIFGLCHALIAFSTGVRVLILFAGGVIVAGLGLAAIAGYLAGVETAYQWPNSVAMTPASAAGLWLLGAAHLVIARQPALQVSSRLPFTIAALAIPAGFFFDLAAPAYLGASFVYIPVILSGIWFTDRRAAFALASICVVFSFLGYIAKLQPLDIDQQRLLARLFGAGTDFIVAILIYYFKRVSEQNEQGRLRFDTLIDAAPDAVVMIDPSGTIRQFNPAAERLFGYAESGMLGQNVKILMPEPYYSAHDGYLKHHADTGERHIIGTIREVRGKRADGSTFPLDLSISELPADGGKEFVGVLRDLTVRKRQEENLREALGRLAAYAADLERSNKELDDFAYIASHDLKEPLRGIHNHSRFLLEDYDERLDQDGKRRLDRLVHLSQRMEKLVNDLLYFSRIGRAELAIRPTDISAMLREIVSTLEQFLEERNARVIVAGDLPEITCDLVRVMEVFRNLIVNAVKYNESAEKIVTVGYLPHHPDETGQMRTRVHFVQDNGKGIASEFYQDIFKMFKRLERANDDDGTGAGLSFVRKIVQRHGGHIWLESEPGKGTTFFFTLASE